LRKWAVRLALLFGALLITICVALYWLLHTATGRDVALKQVATRLPANASFTWKNAEGTLAGPLTLSGVDFRFGDVHFSAGHVGVDADMFALLYKRVHLQTLEIADATLDVPKSNEPFKLPRWPDVLPQIELPLSVKADALRIDRLRLHQAGELLLDVRHASGGIRIGNGYALLDKVSIDSTLAHFTANGHYQPRRNYDTDLTATATFPAKFGKSPAQLNLLAKGNRKRMDASLDGNAPAPLHITAQAQGASKPQWQLHGNAEALDLALFGVVADSLPLKFDLRADGRDGATQLQGKIEAKGYAVDIDPSQLRIDDNKLLTVEPLALRALGGSAVLRGSADFADAANPKIHFAVNARGLRWGKQYNTVTLTDANFDLAGQLQQWSAQGKATLARGEHRAAVAFDSSGDDTQATLRKLSATTPGGMLDATGTLDWLPRLRWNAQAVLTGFDPGYFLPDWNGNLSGNFSSQGNARDRATGFDVALSVPQLRGQLRGRALDANGNFNLRGNQGEGEVALRIGDSRVDARGRIGATLDIAAQLQPLHLSDLLPGAQGTLAGNIAVRGASNAPDIDADLDASHLQWRDYHADTLSVHGRMPWRGSNGDLRIEGANVTAGMALDNVRIHAHGAVENLAFDGKAGSTTVGSVALSGTAARQDADWQGALDALTLTPNKGGAWRLQQTARFTQHGAAWLLSQACLRTDEYGGGKLCAQADWPHDGIKLHSDTLPLTLLQPWLPKSAGRDLGLHGDTRLDAQLKPQANAWAGEVHLASPDGGMKLGTSQRELIHYDNFTFDATFDADTIKGRLGIGFKGDGYADATFNTGWDEFAPLKGELYFNNSRLFWLELFSPDLVRPSGVLAGHIAVAGTRGKPLLNGEATLRNFNGELPSLGIALTDGNGALTALADGSASIHADFASQSTTGDAIPNPGRLNVDGNLSWLDGDAPLRFTVHGDNVLLADTRQLHAIAAPNITVELASGEIRVGGQVTVPSARIDIEKLDSGVSASDDVVVLDPADPTRTPSSRLMLDLSITLGDAVNMKGYGLDGALRGTLSVRSRPGRPMVANGQIDVDGRYAAYGQKLQITEGRLSWSSDAIAAPNISLRAQREVIGAGVTAGISVTGRATQPRARIWSDPELPESEALAYLVLGRSLGTANSDEAQQINAASSALSAGAGLLASQLGAKIGLDDAGVLESRTLGGSVFGIGKYLSPRLYVSYGVSMIGSGSAVTLNYLLSRGFNMEMESGTVETRGSLNWRREK
jgi:translocation and assembly module TamB